MRGWRPQGRAGSTPVDRTPLSISPRPRRPIVGVVSFNGGTVLLDPSRGTSGDALKDLGGISRPKILRILARFPQAPNLTASPPELGFFRKRNSAAKLDAVSGWQVSRLSMNGRVRVRELDSRWALPANRPAASHPRQRLTVSNGGAQSQRADSRLVAERSPGCRKGALRWSAQAGPARLPVSRATMTRRAFFKV